uniref:DNA-directed RNA polymerase III subunit RPC3 n=1 Tax=Cajanus cajan TaxID=3821 RepID=A0A151U677_CAJCA|nr:DNA-directed RNA polymerase III subunit RPC3 [Cajanus cajan]
MATQYGIKFAVHLITNHFGTLVAKVCENLFKHGPLALDQLIHYTELTKEQVKNSLLVLVQHNCAQAFVPAPEDDVGRLRVRTEYMALFDNIIHRLRFPKFLEIVSRKLDEEIFEAPETLEQRVIEAAVPGDGIRFSLTPDTGSNVDGETNSDDAQMSVEENVEEDQILWRANFEEFIRHLRHKVLIENVRTQHDDGTATVLNAVLEATRTGERKVKMDNSVPLSLDAIITEVMKTDTGRTMTIDRIRASLGQLGCSQRMIVDDSYSIDLKKIIERARNEEVDSIVLKRYGRDAYRMFRLLSKDGEFRDTDQIAASTLVEKKEAPKLLYKLWDDNYLYMEKIPVSGAKIPNTFILMWKVNKPLLWEYVLDEMYHAALNLNLRMAFEQEKDEELLNVPKDKLKEPGPLQKKYKRLQNVWLLLGSSLMKLDDALMLFHDF